MRHYSIALALILLLGPSQSVESVEPQKLESLSISLPVPLGIDDATRQRIAQGYTEEKKSLAKLVIELDQNQFDYSIDSLIDIHQKRDNVRQVMSVANSMLLRGMHNQEMEIDYARVCWEVVPRLNGRSWHVGPTEKWKSLGDVLPKIQSGDLIVLTAGLHEVDLPDHWTPPHDLVLAGKGPEVTILRFSDDPFQGHFPSTVKRWRFADLSIDCSSERSHFGTAIPGGCVHLKNCHITNVSGHKNALEEGQVLLIEDCRFEGGKDRFDRHGSVFGHSSNCHAIYVRNTRFVNVTIAEYGIRSPIILDGCHFGRNGPDHSRFQGQYVLMRNCSGWISITKFKTFKVAADDVECIDFVLGKRPSESDRIRRLAEGVQYARNPIYWLSMLRHGNPKIRAQAAARPEKLLQLKIEVTDDPDLPKTTHQVAQEKIDDAIQKLDSDEYLVRVQARQRLRKIGAPAALALGALLEWGSLEQQKSARMLLTRIAGTPTSVPLSMKWDVEYGRLSRWYADHRSALKWDQHSGTFKLASR
jgi:hypothetical protein